MKKDYHIHAQLLTAPDRAEAFVEKAIEKGFGEICITDHMPLSISSARDRIPHGKIKEYVLRVRDLAAKYENRISIRTGIEIDYHPSFTSEIETVLGENSFDYILGSSHLHLLTEKYFDPPVTRTEYVKAMMENTALAARSGYFDAIAHMDMYKWVFTRTGRHAAPIDDGYAEEAYGDLFDEALLAIRENGLYLEINAHFAESTGRLENAYPSEFILKRALSLGLKISYGSDAHKPESVGAMWDALWEHPTYGRALCQWEQDAIGGKQ